MNRPNNHVKKILRDAFERTKQGSYEDRWQMIVRGITREEVEYFSELGFETIFSKEKNKEYYWGVFSWKEAFFQKKLTVSQNMYLKGLTNKTPKVENLAQRYYLETMIALGIHSWLAFQCKNIKS